MEQIHPINRRTERHPIGRHTSPVAVPVTAEYLRSSTNRVGVRLMTSVIPWPHLRCGEFDRLRDRVAE